MWAFDVNICIGWGVLVIKSKNQELGYLSPYSATDILLNHCLTRCFLPHLLKYKSKENSIVFHLFPVYFVHLTK